MRILFLGTPEPAAEVLERLLASRHEVVAVVTQPDRPAGRGRRRAEPPVKVLARSRGLPVLQFESARPPGVADALAAFRPDVLVVVAYGEILPPALLALAPRGSVNVHFSLLPRHRGAAPVQRALLAGDRETGVTTMLMDEGLDTGPILLGRAVEIGPEETTPQLEERLARLGGTLLLETLDGLEAGTVRPRAQDPEGATKAPSIRKQEGDAPWEDGAEALFARWRAFQPWPGLYTFAEGRRVLLSAVRRGEGGATGPPGKVLGPEGESVAVACGGGGRLLLLRVRPEGRAEMTGRAAWNGRILREGLLLRRGPG